MLRALETAPLLVVGRVEDVTPLLHVGYAAGFAVGRVLRGASDASLKNGQRIELVWEEPSPQLRPRLGAGQRIVVALDTAPTASIWKQRIPDSARWAALYALAARGQGYLQQASAGTLGILEHYLALSDAARRGEAGATYLSQLAAMAPPRLALDVVERFRSEPALIEALTLPAAQALVATMLRTDAEAVADRALQLVEEERPAVLLPVLEAEIGGKGLAASSRLLAARAALEEGLPEGLEEQLLESGSEQQRVTAVRWATGPQASERLRYAMLRDRSAAVREAALIRLAGIEGAAATADVLQGLEDPESSVQFAAARTMASFGADALPDLRRTIDRGSPSATRAALAAISLMSGEEARTALEDLAENHGDDAVRGMARVILTGSLGGDN